MYSYWVEPCCSVCEESWDTKTPLLHHTFWYISLPFCAHLGERPSCLLHRFPKAQWGALSEESEIKREITCESWRQARSARGEWWERAQSDCRVSRRVQKKWSLETGDEAERPTQPRPKGSLWAHPFFREKPWGRGCQPTQTSKGFLPSRVPFPRQRSHFMQGYPRKSWILDSKLIPVTGLRILIIVSGAPDSGIMFTLHGILHDGVTKNVFPK